MGAPDCITLGSPDITQTDKQQGRPKPPLFLHQLLFAFVCWLCEKAANPTYASFELPGCFQHHQSLVGFDTSSVRIATVVRLNQMQRNVLRQVVNGLH